MPPKIHWSKTRRGRKMTRQRYQRNRTQLLLRAKKQYQDALKLGLCTTCRKRKPKKGLRSCQRCIDQGVIRSLQSILNRKNKQQNYLDKINEKIRLGLLKEMQQSQELKTNNQTRTEHVYLATGLLSKNNTAKAAYQMAKAVYQKETNDRSKQNQ